MKKPRGVGLAMGDVTEDTKHYLATFEGFAKTAAENGRSWTRPLREAAIARFAALGFPTARDEEWRFTNVAPIVRRRFAPAGCNGPALSPGRLEPFLLQDTPGSRLVFVNGRYAAALSSPGPLPDGAVVASLAAALDRHRALIEPHLGRHARYDTEAFTALNTAFLEDGAFVYVPAGTVVEQPIHLLFVSTAAGEDCVTHPRNLVVAGARSRVSLVESYVALADTVYFTNPVTEVVAGPDAVIDHYKLQQESAEAFHVAALHVHQDRGAAVSSHSVALGGALVRNHVHAMLDGEGCDCTLNGLYLAGGRQHVDNHLRVEHARPHCTSREFYKGILDGASHGVFSGRIVVHKDAQRTDARQTNRNLLLSASAQIDTKPQLEIFADDVRCTHGATIGQIDEEAAFYLRSRGISRDVARSLLIYAFANESLDDVKLDPVRAQVRDVLLARLPRGALLRGTL